MKLKLKIENNNFIYEDKPYPIIESFVEFLNTYKSDIDTMENLFLDIKNNKILDEYYIRKNNNFPLFYFTLFSIPSNIEELLLKYSSINSEQKDIIDKFFYEQEIASNIFYNYFRGLERAVNICFNLSDNPYKDLSLLERYSICIEEGLLPSEFSIDIKKYIKYNQSDFITYIEFQDIISLCLYVFNEMLKNNTIIKNCKNCGKLFIADNKREYCNGKNEYGNICSDIGSINLFKDKRKNDILLHEYTKAYKRLQNFCYKNKNKISKETQKHLFNEIRIIYDKARNDITNQDIYIKQFNTYNNDFFKHILCQK